MPLLRPTQAELITRIGADMRTRVAGVEPLLRRSVAGVISSVQAGAAHLLYAAIEWASLQIHPDTAAADELERHASLHLATGRLPAAAATGSIALTGTDATVIPVGTRYQCADGVEYDTTAEGTIAGGVASVPVIAVAAGQDGNIDAGAGVVIITPIAGLDAEGVVEAPGIASGTDVENDEALRLRLREHLHQPPHGGADFDYVTWCKEVPGVTRAWVVKHGMGIGTVLVYFVRDNDASIIPDAGEVAAVQAYVDPLRPVAVRDLYIVAPIAVPVTFTITGQLTAEGQNTLSLRDAIEAELADLIAREAQPGGTDPTGGVLKISRIREAVSTAAGEFDHSITDPVADLTPTAGQIYTFGGVTWA